MKNYIKNYPRPQFVRNKWVNLNGDWNFTFDDENLGEEKEYYISFPTRNKINVPFTYETELSEIKDESVHYVVWYNKKIHISKENEKAILHFEGSDYKTKIWINGKYIGTNEGGYHRFSFEIDKYIKEGENDITIRVEDSLAKEQPRGKQRYKKESWKCWYIQTTGIWKTVWIEYVPKYYMKNVKLTPNLDNKNIQLEYETNISEKELEENNFYIETEISFENELLITNKIQLTELYQENEILICENNAEVKKWSPKEPNLYDICYKLYCNDKLIDIAYSYFGFRKISIQKNRIYLNDDELYLKFILDQGYWKESHLTPPSEDALIKDIEIALKYGYNGVRKHQKIEDERFLYWCDVKGMLVWSEMANCYNYNDKSIQQFTNEWIKVVKQNYNHPSIITWIPINESWGLPNISDNIKQQNYANSLYYLTKSIDNTRPVISNDGWEHTISDIITIHDYKQDPELFFLTYTDDEKKVLNNMEKHNGKHKLFAEGYRYNGQPVIMSEYGGIALDSEKGWGYGKQVANEDEFIQRFELLTKNIKKIPYISGYCYTQLTDVQQEINGLVDEHRNSKFSKKVEDKIKEINEF